MFLKSHDSAYWSARALDAQNRAERCRGDCVRLSLLLELAEDYSWLADRVRPCRASFQCAGRSPAVPQTVTRSWQKHTRNERLFP